LTRFKILNLFVGGQSGGVCGVCGVWCEYRKEKTYHIHTNPIAIESFNISHLIYLITSLPTLVSKL
jgi:hypothetical protein